jgi:hypothetical protein
MKINYDIIIIAVSCYISFNNLLLICVLFLACLQNCEKRLLDYYLPVCPSVRIKQFSSTLRTPWNLRFVFFESPSRKLKLNYNLTRITGTLHEDQYTFMIIRRWFLLRIVNVGWDKRCSENQNTILCSITFFFDNITVCKIMWINCCKAGEATDGNKHRAWACYAV